MSQLSDHQQILIKPVLTEKSTEGQERLNSYRFEVAGGANKIEIKEALEAIFEVKVKSVNTLIRVGKTRRRGANYYVTATRKIAVVQLEEGQKIDLL
jgi:large subunit ribosomal protein L23